MSVYRTTDTTVLAHQQEQCIECQSTNVVETVSLPSADEEYKCQDCELVIGIAEGEVVARGDMSEEVVDTFSFEIAHKF